VSILKVRLWGRHVASVEMQGDIAVFQYTPDFASSGIELSPLHLPLQRAPYSFPPCRVPPSTVCRGSCPTPCPIASATR